jgi:hypothetical protein
VSARSAELRVVRIDLATVGACCGQQRVSTGITELVHTWVAHPALVAIDDVGGGFLLFHRVILTLSFCHCTTSYVLLALLGLDAFPSSCASSDNVQTSDARESKHVIRVVNETTADHAHFDLVQRFNSSRVLTGSWHIWVKRDKHSHAWRNEGLA